MPQNKSTTVVYNQTEFTEYLEERLIPDLKEMGHPSTALDFEAAVLFMRNSAHLPSTKVVVDLENNTAKLVEDTDEESGD